MHEHFKHDELHLIVVGIIKAFMSYVVGRIQSGIRALVSTPSFYSSTTIGKF